MTIKLEAQKREILGRKVKALRKEGFVPAEIFGPEIENKHILISQKDFNKVYKEAGKNTIIEVNIEDEKKVIPTMITDIQIHPLNRKPLSVDFYMVSRDTKIEAEVPLKFVGEAPAEKDDLIVIKVLNEIEVEALPQDIPHEIEVNITNLKTTKDHILVEHLNIPSNVELVTPPETTVVTVSEKEEEIVEEETTPLAEELEEEVKDEKEKEEDSSPKNKEQSEKENG
jgi:large subunit ribosomal protein L25